ncbi:MAG: hypothetical protein ABIO70_05160 [Pseudomonadota bacterium]
MLLPSLLLLAPALAGTPVLVSRIDVDGDASAAVAGALAEALAAAYEPLSPTEAAVDGQPGPAWLAACEAEELEGCTFRLAEAAGAAWAITGRVEGGQAEIALLDVGKLEQGAELVLPFDADDLAAFAAAVRAGLDDAVAGRAREAVDIRVQAAEEAAEPLAPYDPEQDPELVGREAAGLEDERISPDEGPEWEERPRYSMAAMMAELGDEAPWDLEGLSPKEYLSYWNSGWDVDTWRELARGRKGRVLLRLAGGGGWGPGGALYHGRYALEANTNRLLGVYAVQQVQAGAGSSLGLSVGFGVAPWLEIEAGIAREGGHYHVEIFKEIGEAEPEVHTDDVSPNGNLRVHVGLRLAPMPVPRLRPLVGLGVAYQRGTVVTDHASLPMDDFEVFAAPSLVCAYLAPGGELRLSERLDLFVQAPLTLVLAGGESEEIDTAGDALEDKLGTAAVPRFGAALQVGVQGRVGR